MGVEEQKLFPLGEYIRPEDLFCDSLYLLFSDEREREKEISQIVLNACREANLDPKKLFVRDHEIILLCDCHVPISQYHSVSENLKPESYFLFKQGVSEVHAGPLPYKELEKKVEDYVYSFRQGL